MEALTLAESRLHYELMLAQGAFAVESCSRLERVEDTLDSLASDQYGRLPASLSQKELLGAIARFY